MPNLMNLCARGGLAFLASLFSLTTAFALDAGSGQAVPWQIRLMQPATELMAELVWFHDLLLWVITLITLFVLALLIYVCWRFSEKKNPVPSKTTHNTLVEVAWTVIPIIILVMISIPSFKILYKQQVIPKADITIKAIGKQWFWTYEYAGADGKTAFSFDQLMLDEKDRAKAVAAGKDAPRMLAVDNEVVLPINKVIRVNTTAADVIHGWTIPAFGVKSDSVPGRLNSMWFKAEKEGLYYGQCSKLCGKDHSSMPIAVRIVSQDKYDAWVKEAAKKFAAHESDNATQVAGQ
jgi:cytochrome c oxidase subunit II